MPRTGYDFTVRPASQCHGCGYRLNGLSPTRRCPECGVHVAASLYSDLVASWRRDAATEQRAFELAVFRTEWRAALVMAGSGVFLAMTSVLLALSLDRALTAALPSLLIGAAGSVAMFIALLLSERLGLVGLPSRRSAFVLSIAINMFVVGVMCALDLVTHAGFFPPLQLLLSVGALALVIERSAPNPIPVLGLVMLSQVMLCAVFILGPLVLA